MHTVEQGPQHECKSILFFIALSLYHARTEKVKRRKQKHRLMNAYIFINYLNSATSIFNIFSHSFLIFSTFIFDISLHLFYISPHHIRYLFLTILYIYHTLINIFNLIKSLRFGLAPNYPPRTSSSLARLALSSYTQSPFPLFYTR